MALLVFFIALVFIALLLALFFIFSALIPAMRARSFSVDRPLFSPFETGEGTDGWERAAPRGAKGRRAVVTAPLDDGAALLPPGLSDMGSCRAAAEAFAPTELCRFPCAALGDCAAVCPQEAIDISDGRAVVTDLCSGCGECVSACPKNFIAMEDISDLGKNSAAEIPEKKGFKMWRNLREALEGVFGDEERGRG